MKKLTFILFIYLVCKVFTIVAQNSVSIGTEEINENAVLQLVSPDNNQGFLVPRVTTAQRMAMDLGAGDNGMMVFDNNENRFYYWHNGGWYAFAINAGGPLNAVLNGNSLQINSNGETTNVELGSLIDDNDADPSNEIQDLNLTGNNLSITNNSAATALDLSVYLDNTDSQNLTFNTNTNVLSVSNGNTVDLSSLEDDADPDPYNELNTGITFDGSNLTIIDAGGNQTIDISSLEDDADADPYNELNSGINFDGSILTITDAGGNQAIDISSLGNDADADPSNEIQGLNLNGNLLSITNNSAATAIDLSAYLDNTDGQQLAFNTSSGELSISGGNTVDLTSLSNTNSWNLGGNGGTNPAVDYIGTSDETSLSIRTFGLNRVIIDGSSGFVGIGNTNPQQQLHINGNLRADGNLQINPNGYIDDDATFGGYNDDWIRLSDFIEMRPNNSTYGLVIRDNANDQYMSLTQTGGYSYFSNNNTSANFFLRGIGGDAHVRLNLTAGQSIISGNGYDVTSGDQFMYTNTQTRYKIYGPTSLSGNEAFTLETYGRYARNINGRVFIPIDVPNGATVTQVTVRVYDNDAGGFLNPDNNISSCVYLYNYTNREVYDIGVVVQSTSGIETNRAFTFNVNYSPEPNNGQLFVWINCAENSDQHRFYCARVAYTVNRAD